MRIELAFTRDRAYAKRLYKYLRRKAIAVRVVVGSILILLSVPFWVVDKLKNPYIGALYLVAGLLFLWQAAMVGAHLARRMPAYWYAPQEMTLTEESVAFRTELAKAEFAWSAITSVDLCDDALLLRIGAIHVWDVPRAALTHDQLLTLIKHCGQRSMPAAMFLNEHDRIDA